MSIAFAPDGYERFSILDNPLRMPEESPIPATVTQRKAETIGDLPAAAPRYAPDKEGCSPRDQKQGTPPHAPSTAAPLLSRTTGTGRADAVRAAAEMSGSQGPDFVGYLAAPDPEIVAQRYVSRETASRPTVSLLA